MRAEIEQRRKKDLEQNMRVRDMDSQCKIQQRLIRQQQEELRQLRAFKVFSAAKSCENVAAAAELRKTEKARETSAKDNAGGHKAKATEAEEPPSSVLRAEHGIIVLEEQMAQESKAREMPFIPRGEVRSKTSMGQHLKKHLPAI